MTWNTTESTPEDTDIQAMLKMLHGLGSTQVDVDYNGSGDDGSINDVLFYTGTEEFDGDILNEEHVKETIKEKCYDLLAHQDFDWVNNEGGYGILEINTATGQVLIKHNARVESSEYHEIEEQL